MSAPQKPDIQRLLEFQKLLNSFASIERRIDVDHMGKLVPESDTEHSYNLAMTAWFLSEYFPQLNQNKLIQYAMVHDLVEIHAGDTYAYGTVDELASKEAREGTAARRLSEDWLDFPAMAISMQTYEKRLDEESKFIYALDKIMPIMANYLTDGYSWKVQGVSFAQERALKAPKTAVSPEIHAYYLQLDELLSQNPDLFHPTKE